MSFAFQVKEELLSLETDSPCCKFAEAYGMLLFGKTFSASSISLQTENEEIAYKYSECVSDVTGITPAVKSTSSGKYSVSIRSQQDRLTVLSIFGHTGNEIALHINRANLANECCTRAFLRGTFLSCGTITDPEKDYHIEFSIQHLYISRDLEKIMTELDLSPKEVMRKGCHIIYFKESESIENVLTYIGAAHSSLEIMGIKIYKDFRNKANRMTNCETANISRTVAAACEQIKAIRLIEKTKGLDCLPDELKELAEIRKDNPEMSLRELGQQLSVPLSRSGVNHRMKKIQEIADEIRIK